MRIKRLPHAEDLPLPARETHGAAGFDLRAAIDAPITIQPGERALVPTGFCWELQQSLVGLVCPRSGLANKFGVAVLNAPGVVDWDYRGEVKVLLINSGDMAVEISRGERIAQLVLSVFADPILEEVDELNDTIRGAGGFGSTGA